MQQNTTTTTEKASTEKQNVAEMFGNGRYSNVMKELFHDCQKTLGLSEQQSLRVAKEFGVDLGRLQAANGAKVTFGALAKKDRTITLKDSVTVKGVILTNALAVAKSVVLAKEMENYGVKSVDVEFNANVMEWLNKE